MMDEYIKKQDVLKIVQNTHRPLLYSCEKIRALPAADVKEVRHGKWEDKDFYECSCCRFKVWGNVIEVWHYCPNCGADMRGVENAEIH